MKDNNCCQDYIDLLKMSLSGDLSTEMGMRLSYLLLCMDTGTPYSLEHLKNIKAAERDKYDSLRADKHCESNYRERIFGFPTTMIGEARLNNIENCVKAVIRDGVEGDLMETGVWRGGATIFMRGLLKALAISNRTIWVADSFQGVPKPTLEQDKGIDLYLDPMLSVDLDTVKENFRKYGLLDSQVQFIEGWFEDTMPTAPVEKLCLLRLDGDLYKSTMDVLLHMYDKVQPGGFIIIDDYGAYPACKQAVADYRDSRSIRDPIVEIDWTGAFWRKE